MQIKLLLLDNNNDNNNNCNHLTMCKQFNSGSFQNNPQRVDMP